MIRARYMARHRAMSIRWRQLIVPPLVAALVALVVLLGVYSHPFAAQYDIGSQPAPLGNVYDGERNNERSFAYTEGNAQLRLPHVGAGLYDVRITMGAPGERLPTNAAATAASTRVNLGTITHIRTYNLLLPSDVQGDLNVHLPSDTHDVAGDWRHPGLLLDRIEIAAVGSAGASASLLLHALGLAALLSLIIALLGTTLRAKLALTAVSGAGVGVGYALSRGVVALQLPWIIAAVAATVAAVLLLSTIDRWPITSPVLIISLLFLTWRLALWLIGGLSIWYSHAVYPFAEALSFDGGLYDRDRLLWTALTEGWLHWDSEHYLSIAQRGYRFWGQRWPSIAFFPLYPLLIRGMLPVVADNVALAALLVSHAAFWVALLLLYDLVARDWNRAVALRTIAILLIFPTSFFFVAAYTESLALLLAVLAVWAMRRQRWWLAGIAGALLALTRLPGVLIAPVLALVYLQHLGWRWRAIRWPALATLLPPSGLAAFMLYQWWRFGTPIAFMLAQRKWDNQLSPPWIMAEVMWNKLFTSPDWPVIAFHGIFWLVFIPLTIAALRKLPLAYSATTALLLLPPYLSSWPWSLSRHVLIAFPVFVVLGLAAQPIWTRKLLLTTCLPLLIVTVVLFVNGWWIA
jgi:hypothetical protein